MTLKAETLLNEDGAAYLNMKNIDLTIEKLGDLNTGLTVKVISGAECALYAGAPLSRKYSSIISENTPIEPTEIISADETCAYSYRDLAPGVYHFVAAKCGYTGICKVINFSEEKAAHGATECIILEPTAGDGYEEGFMLLYSDEFVSSHLASDKYAWGEEFARIFCSPQFTRLPGTHAKHQQTTNDEMQEFIKKFAATSEKMHVYSLGKSPKNSFDMPLVLFTNEDVCGKSLSEAAEIVRKNGKPTVQYTAEVHATEPCSCEGALCMMAELCREYGDELLDKIDVYIVPRINLDGAVEGVRHSPTTGEDMNRDYLFMNNKEIRMVTSAYNLFLPEVAIDAHEKFPYVTSAAESHCTDMEIQIGGGALNHPAVITALGMDAALYTFERARGFGIRGRFYSNFASAMGGSAGSSYYGARNSISLLVETPGISLGMAFKERRVMSQYLFASSIFNYTAEHACEILKAVHESRESMSALGEIYDESRLIVLEHTRGETGSVPTPIINIPTGEVIDPARAMKYDEHTGIAKSRPRPTAYVIPKGCENEDEILRVADCHAIKYYTLPCGSEIILRQYVTEGEEINLDCERPIKFNTGAYVFPNNTPSTITSVIMEPDFNTASGRKMCLYSMKLISANEEGKLPIYRYEKNLKDGKI